MVTAKPATSDTRVWHENARLPSMCTMQAPHSPVPQPNLVPVSLSSSRITHNSGVSAGACERAGLPLTVKSNAMAASTEMIWIGFGPEPRANPRGKSRLPSGGSSLRRDRAFVERPCGRLFTRVRRDRGRSRQGFHGGVIGRCRHPRLCVRSSPLSMRIAAPRAPSR